jgi:RanBP1 domain
MLSKTVELAGKDSVSSGEEHEETRFKTRAKLYRLQDDKNAADQWVEKGIGEFKINVQREEAKKVRLIMRMDQTHRLLLNNSVFAQMLVTEAGDKGTRFVLAENNLPATYLLRVNTIQEAQDVRKHLRDAIDALKA